MRYVTACILVCGAFVAPGTPACAEQLVFADGFEAGHLCYWDAGAPSLDCDVPAPSLFLLNGSSGYPVAVPTGNPVASFDLEVADAGRGAITEYCVKRLSSSPAPDHECWRPVPGVPAPVL